MLLIFFINKSFALYQYYNPTNRKLGANRATIIKGDIDDDGSVTINDVAVLKLYLIGKRTLSDNQIELANLDNDEIVSVNDLAVLKLILINSDEEELDISNHQFTYHVTGKLKEAFEEKLNGEKIDYSVDKFYSVKNSNDKNLIYNPYRKITLEVPEDYELHKRTATWLWRPLNIEEEKQPEFLDNLKETYGITDIYLHLSVRYFKLNHSSNEFNLEKLKRFVELAYDRDIRVYCLVGDASYLAEDKWQLTINDLIDDVDNYNKSVNVSQRLAGISYDNEFWLNPEWKTDESVRKQHVKYIETAVQYAKTKNLDVNFAFNFTIPRYTYTDDNGSTVNMYDAVSKLLEEPVLMIYRDSVDKIYEYINTIQTNAENSMIGYAKKNDSSINIAIDVVKHEPTESNPNPEKQTFYEEESADFGKEGAIYKAFRTLSSYCTENNEWDEFTFSIHHAETLADLINDNINEN